LGLNPSGQFPINEEENATLIHHGSRTKRIRKWFQKKISKVTKFMSCVKREEK